VTRGDQSGGTTITISNGASKLSTSSEKGEEMPQELLSRIREFEISNPLGVGAKRLKKISEDKI